MAYSMFACVASFWARYLDIIMRVPVGVVDDDGVCGCQVYAQPSCSCGQQEAELLGTWRCSTQPRIVSVCGVCVCVCVFVWT